MPAVLEELQSVESRRRKLVGRIVFGLMVLLSALIGALGGLLLIYSTDLPQVEHLENYRPISTTELYDVHGHIIGTFAHHRRGLSRRRIGRAGAGRLNPDYATGAQSVSLT